MRDLVTPSFSNAVNFLTSTDKLLINRTFELLYSPQRRTETYRKWSVISNGSKINRRDNRKTCQLWRAETSFQSRYRERQIMVDGPLRPIVPFRCLIHGIKKILFLVLVSETTDSHSSNAFPISWN